MGLVLVFATAMTPARGFVLCIESDGCVRIELRAPDKECLDCDGHADATANAGAEADPCACIDLAVPGARHEQRVEARSIRSFVDLCVGPAVVAVVEHLAPADVSVCGPPPAVPRVAESLGHIRSIVLLV